METISKQHARRLALRSQGLLNEAPFGKGWNAVARLFEQIGYVQIDTISVIERAHHHILRTRVGNYHADMLDDLQVRNRRVFEYWAHAAAYLPLSDYRYCLPRMQALANGHTHWYQRDEKTMNYVLDRIRTEGPLQAKDFQRPGGRKAGPWWDWHPAKKALEQCFHEGSLMVVQRKNFQKVYDLTERVLPADISLATPTIEETAAHLIRRAIRSHGFTSETEAGYLRKGMKTPIKKVIPRMLKEGEIVPLRIEDLADTYYTFAGVPGRMPALPRKKRVALLSPFDNTVIQRKRTQKIFDFDFQIECYVPAPKRKYGYFNLPILYGDRFVGRLDPKAERRRQHFMIQNLVLEPGFDADDAFLSTLAGSIREFAGFNGCETIEIKRTTPAGIAAVLRRIL